MFTSRFGRVLQEQVDRSLFQQTGNCLFFQTYKRNASLKIELEGSLRERRFPQQEYLGGGETQLEIETKSWKCRPTARALSQIQKVNMHMEYEYLKVRIWSGSPPLNFINEGGRRGAEGSRRSLLIIKKLKRTSLLTGNVRLRTPFWIRKEQFN